MLGVDCIWISPFFTSPMKDFGYDVSDYCDVDPIFGTLADFDELIAESHRLGLKVMIDQVLSHCSSEHPWFIESRSSRDNPKRDWYIWRDPAPDGRPPNNWLSMFGGPAWTFDAATYSDWWAEAGHYYYVNVQVREMFSVPDLGEHLAQARVEEQRRPEVHDARHVCVHVHDGEIRR